MQKIDPIAVIGAGSWGTALAMLLAKNGRSVNLWGRDEAQLQTMRSEGRNQRYLPDINFTASLNIHLDLQSTLVNVNDILLAVPAKGIRDTLQRIQPYTHKSTRIILASKGFDPSNLSPLHEVVASEFGQSLPLSVISGPTFAIEVARGLPTAITIASSNEKFARELGLSLQNEVFRVYTSKDVVGVEIAGTVKNVMAIAAGIADGMGFGANTRAALITRGLHEIMKLGLELGGKPETFMGLAGLGDLVLTCTDDKSRNRRVGLGLAANKSIEKILEELGQVAEGIATTKNVHLLAKNLDLEMPIVEQVHDVIYNGKSPAKAVEDLLRREPRAES